jgi:predicted nucleic acid-binding protein
MNKNERLERAANELYHALKVICKTRKISHHLYMNDMKALLQCQTAINIYENRDDKRWMEIAYNGRAKDELLA